MTKEPNAPIVPLWFLYLTAAIAGAAIMIVEILGARMLAPYVGTSHFVWTAQIGVTLLALATGYYTGGWLVDRSPHPDKLYFCIGLSAICLALTVIFCEPIALRCSGLSLETGSILISACLFFPPLTLLATVGPFLVRLATPSLGVLGKFAGRLSAISTLGSVCGTGLIGYYLIPRYPGSFSMLLTASVLMGLSLLYFICWRRPVLKASLLLAGAMILSLLVSVSDPLKHQYESWVNRELVYEASSAFGDLQVIRNKSNGQLILLNDFLQQNSYDPVRQQSLSVFTYMLHELAWAYFDSSRSDSGRITDVLCIGMGVGIVPMDFVRDAAAVDVVEINPTMLPVAERYFDLNREGMNVYFEDGRTFLNRTDRIYDAVILDAFLGDSSPSHLMSREAFESMKKHLRPGGVLVINSFADFQEGSDFMAQSLLHTLRAVFRSVRIHEASTHNAFFVASDREELTAMGELDVQAMHPQVREIVADAFARTVSLPDRQALVLTDDYNPVEFYDAINREKRRRSFVAGVRSF